LRKIHLDSGYTSIYHFPEGLKTYLVGSSAIPPIGLKPPVIMVSKNISEYPRVEKFKKMFLLRA
jgi:hypothetical protein